MGFVNKYPYVDFHELNADALITKVDDASAKAKAAAETVATYNDRLTTVEGDLAPIKSAMPGIASSISDLTSGLGRVSSQVTTNTQDIADNAANIDNIEDRLTTYDRNFVNINNTFISDERRIGELEEYRTEAQVKIGNLGYSVAPLFDENAAYSTGDYVMSPTLKLHRAIVDIPAGTANIHDLTQFQPTDISNALHEGVLPLVTSADAGDVLTVDNNGDWVAATPGGSSTPITITAASNITIISNKSKRIGNTVIIDFSFSTDAIINANDYIVTTQFIAPGNAAPNYFVTQSNVPVSQRMLLNVNGYLTSAESIAQGVTIVVNYRYEV